MKAYYLVSQACKKWVHVNEQIGRQSEAIRFRANLRITFGQYVKVKGSLRQGKTFNNPPITTVRKLDK